MSKQMIRFLLLALFIAFLNGCGLIYLPGTFNEVYNKTLKSACIECHVPGGNAGGSSLDFSTQAKAFSTLTSATVGGNTSVGICSGVKIVDAGSPATSYLAAVLFSDYSKSNFVKSGCTPYSAHHSDQSLSSTEKDSIIKWITDGALDN